MLSMANNYPEFVVEITVLSAENLKKPSFTLLSGRRLRPFISIGESNGNNARSDHNRKGYDGKYFTLGEHKFLVPIKANFFANIHSCIHLQLHAKSLFGCRALLGWCPIPAADIGASPVGLFRHLSYRLRAKDGSKGYGTVNLKVKLEGYGSLAPSGQEVIGLPINMLPPQDFADGINWPEER